MFCPTLRLAALAALFALAACAANEPDPITLQLSNEPPLQIGGMRAARVFLPEDYDVSKRYPLIFLLHGYSANSEAQNIIFQMKQRVSRDRFILVLPEGTKNKAGKQFWNATPECCDFDNSGVDDVAYLGSLIEEAKTLYAIDPARVSFVGHSNGGYMSYRLACEIPEHISRVAVLAGSVFLDEADCVGKKAVSVLHMHGTEDDLVPYHNNLSEMKSDVWRIDTVGAEEAIGRWRLKAGCAANAAPPVSGDFLTGVAGAETQILSWPGCQDEKEITLWRMVMGDHLFLDANEAFRDAIAAFLLGNK
jgi:polyhydroxybutyrate depolymerase